MIGDGRSIYSWVRFVTANICSSSILLVSITACLEGMVDAEQFVVAYYPCRSRSCFGSWIRNNNGGRTVGKEAIILIGRRSYWRIDSFSFRAIGPINDAHSLKSIFFDESSRINTTSDGFRVCSAVFWTAGCCCCCLCRVSVLIRAREKEPLPT